jgi:hypothetical protein
MKDIKPTIALPSSQIVTMTGIKPTIALSSAQKAIMAGIKPTNTLQSRLQISHDVGERL